MNSKIITHRIRVETTKAELEDIDKIRRELNLPKEVWTIAAVDRSIDLSPKAWISFSSENP